MQRLLIYTDLDGTLLDHETYAWQPAAAALERIRSRGIPLILNSSKTFAEISNLRRELKIAEPFIVENGGTVYLPRESDRLDQHRFGLPYDAILAVLDRLRSSGNFDFRGFADMSDNELGDLAGLSTAAAAQARQRSCSEPLLWLGSDEELHRFRSALATHDLQLVKGGRFYHVMGQTDKGHAMDWLTERYRRSYPEETVTTIALGDGANDLPMLERADHAVVIRPARGEPLQLNRKKNVIHTKEKGPAGWQKAIDQLLDRTGE